MRGDGAVVVRKNEHSLASRLGEIAVTNVTNPLIWMAVALLVVMAGMAPFEATRPFAVMLGILLCLVVAVFIGAYIYFAIVDPDRLQSEKHRYQMTSLAMKQQGRSEVRVIEGEPVVPNPGLIAGPGEKKLIGRALAPAPLSDGTMDGAEGE